MDNITYHQSIIPALQRIIKNDLYNNILIVTQKGLAKKLNILDKIKKCFSLKRIFVFDEVIENPRIETIKKGIKFAKSKDINLVIGIGGGSVLDTAKTIALFLNNSGNLLDYLLGKSVIKKESVTMVAIPTTAGTGSEATKYAVINYSKNNKVFKKTLEHKFLIPNFVILNPSLLLTLNHFRTATTGLDALSHAIEAYWSINSNKESDPYSQECIQLIMNYLKKSCDQLDNLRYRKKMLLASNLGGKAINITKTTIVHSVSYPITNYFNIPHGLACALTLPSFLKFNAGITKKTCNDKRGIKFVKRRINNLCKFLGVNNVNAAYKKLNDLIKGIDLKLKLRENNIDNIELIIREGFTPERARNNPRIVTTKDLKNILSNIY